MGGKARYTVEPWESVAGESHHRPQEGGKKEGEGRERKREERTRERETY